MMMSLILLILMYSVICISGWIPSSSRLKPCVRKTISNAILISSFSLTNPITSIALDQPKVTNNKGIVSLATSAVESIDKQAVTNKKETVSTSKQLVTNNKEIVSAAIFADEPIAPSDYARRLDRLELTYFSKDDAASAFKESRSELGILFVVAVSLGYGVREEMKAEMNQTKTEMKAAAKQTKDDMEKMRNETKTQMLQTVALSSSISIFSALSALSPESAGYKFFSSIWKAVQGALHML